MSNLSELNVAKSVLDKHREVVFSMIHDQDKFDAPMVRMWTALASMVQEVEAQDDFISGLQKRLRRQEID